MVTAALELKRADKTIGASLEAAPVVHVEDAALLMDIISLPDHRDPTALAPPRATFRGELARDLTEEQAGIFLDVADGTSAFATGVNVLVGSSSADSVNVTIANLSVASLGIGGLDVSTETGATAAMTTLDTAINTVSAARATIGAQESRFNFSANSISTQTQNLQGANSAITDVDVAQEEATLSSAMVKTQAAVSAETAANQMPQYLLKLLG